VAVQVHPDLELAYRTLREEAGVVERGDRSSLDVTGPDSVEFLQGQVTNDVEALEPGRGCYALLLNPKGRVLADMRILMRSAEELWLDGDAAAMETVAANLRTYKIGRRVEISPSLDRKVVSVIGPRAREVLGVAAPPDEHGFVESAVNGAKLVSVATDAGVDLLFHASDSSSIEQLTAGIQPVSEEAAEVLRIERGRPRFGVDMSDANLPGELGLEERAVSFTKGCYVGQEPVARMHHRGHPNRHLRGLALSRPATNGETVTSASGDGTRAEVGRVGSAAVSPGFGPIALALIRREVEVGADVLVAGGPAKVVRLPFEAE
jgi:folate-binding protein YgfZ